MQTPQLHCSKIEMIVFLLNIFIEHQTQLYRLSLNLVLHTNSVDKNVHRIFRSFVNAPYTICL